MGGGECSLDGPWSLHCCSENRADEKSFVVKEVSGENASTACFSESAVALRGKRALGAQVFLGP